MKKLITSLLFQLSAFITITLSLTSCLDDDLTISQPDPYALVAIYNAVPTSPDMDVFLNGSKIISAPIKYDELISPSPIPAGNSTFNFVAVNSTDTIVSVEYDFENEKTYSIFIVNKTDSTMEALVMQDSLRAVPANTALLRVLHLSPDSRSLYVTRTGTNVPVRSNIYGYKQITPFVEIPATTTNFKLSTTSHGAAIDTIADYNIEPLKVYLLIIKGLSEPQDEATDSLSLRLLRL